MAQLLCVALSMMMVMDEVLNSDLRLENTEFDVKHEAELL
jgi:hypothetical protein